MCGIAGIVSKNIQKEKIESMLKDLSHRGPDNTSYKIYKINEYYIHLGSTRLSIMGDSSDNMPMENDKGGVIIYNGEIFNMKEMNSKVDSNKKYQNDTRLLLDFLSNPTNTIEELNGMFAFAHLNELDKELNIVRDRFGIKPLFYSSNIDDHNELVFCSETKPIINTFKKFRFISKVQIQNSLLYGGIHSDNQTIEGIDILKPGHNLKWKPNSQIIIEEYKSNFKTENFEEFNPDDFEELMCTVLEDHLTASTDIDLFLSGGLDSAYLALLAKRHLGKEIRHFSLTFEKEPFDERTNINFVSEKLSLDKAIFEVKNDKIDEIVINSLENMNNLVLDQSYVPTFFLSNQTSKYTKAVISGDGADELFGGYMWYRASKFHQLSPTVFLKFLKKCFNYLNFPYQENQYLNLTNKIDYFFKEIDQNVYIQNLIWQSFLTDFSDSDIEVLKNKIKYILNDLDNYQNNLRILDLNYYLQSQILSKLDTASMANSLEVRPPFLDNRVVDYALKIDNRTNFNYTKTKLSLLKTLTKTEINKITRQKKHGLAFPLEDWVLQNFENVIQKDLLEELKIDINTLKTHQKNSNFTRFLWSLIVIQYWINRNNLNFN